ncbi:MAG TPA: histidinol-phosphate transaminase, partial [Planctomycetota bacterium]|nr:histidinol-phosphate transaminase [Planctomycetota bacterium]
MQRRTFLQTGVLGFLSTRTALASAPAAALASTTARRRGGPLRLNSNENPLGLSPAAQEAVIRGLAEANRYPHAAHRQMVEVLARHHAVAPEQIVLGAGSSEVLQMSVQAFAQQHATFVLAEPTFEDVQSYCEPWQLQLQRVPLRPDHSHDLARMRRIAEGASGPVVVYVCNPNNPTGTLTPGKELDDWIEASTDHVTFLVDEAYFEFAEGTPGFGSASQWIHKRTNVIVTRTFSKVHAMAGLRLGYGLAHSDTAARLRQLQSHNDINCLAMAAAQASLLDQEHLRLSLDTNSKSRLIVESVLQELGLGFLPSCANFVMHEIRGKLPDYIAHMRDAGILVGRPFPPMLGHNRLTLGTPEDMTRFAET